MQNRMNLFVAIHAVSDLASQDANKNEVGARLNELVNQLQSSNLDDLANLTGGIIDDLFEEDVALAGISTRVSALGARIRDQTIKSLKQEAKALQKRRKMGLEDNAPPLGAPSISMPPTEDTRPDAHFRTVLNRCSDIMLHVGDENRSQIFQAYRDSDAFITSNDVLERIDEVIADLNKIFDPVEDFEELSESALELFPPEAPVEEDAEMVTDVGEEPAPGVRDSAAPTQPVTPDREAEPATTDTGSRRMGRRSFAVMLLVIVIACTSSTVWFMQHFFRGVAEVTSFREDVYEAGPNLPVPTTKVCGTNKNGEKILPVLVYQDNDGDGWGSGESTEVCEPSPQHVAMDGDCNDEDPSTHPQAHEPWRENVDRNCDGRLPFFLELLGNVGPTIRPVPDHKRLACDVDVMKGNVTGVNLGPDIGIITLHGVQRNDRGECVLEGLLAQLVSRDCVLNLEVDEQRPATRACPMVWRFR